MQELKNLAMLEMQKDWCSFKFAGLLGRVWVGVGFELGFGHQK